MNNITHRNNRTLTAILALVVSIIFCHQPGLSPAGLSAHDTDLSTATAGPSVDQVGETPGADVGRIGVPANRGATQWRDQLGTTAKYVDENIDGTRFKPGPLSFDEIREVVDDQSIDSLRANPAVFVRIQNDFGIRPVAAIINFRDERTSWRFGGTIFTQPSGSNGFTSAQDLRNSSIMGVSLYSSGGWMAPLRRPRDGGLDLLHDATARDFAGTHDAVVEADKKGKADLSMVRAGQLETRDSGGAIDMGNYDIPTYPETPAH
ncbi:MAG: PhnD/SsuA/transferrin family substrate-binding protein, partial [Planctomycetota bacterium]